MKNFLLLIAASFSFFMASAQAPDVPADKGTVFGKSVTVDDAIFVETMQINLQNKVGEKKLDVKVRGTVNAVCAAEGCWLKMKSEKGDIMVRMKDHAFFVPLILNGKEIIVDGMAEEKITSVDMLRHYAEDAGKSKAEIDAITQPKKEVVINAVGILVL